LPTEPFGINGVARLFEGEGSIFTSARHTYTRRRTLRIQIQMIDRDVIEALGAEFGGAVGAYVRRSTGKPYYQWALTGARAAILAQRMLPYLFGNREDDDPEFGVFRRGCEGDVP
jgi:hypothetical protein